LWNASHGSFLAAVGHADEPGQADAFRLDTPLGIVLLALEVVVERALWSRRHFTTTVSRGVRVTVPAEISRATVKQ